MAGDTIDLSGALNKLMSDPSLLQSIASAIGGTSQKNETLPRPDDTSEKDVSAVSQASQKPSDDLSDNISDILPAISKLSALGNLSSPQKNASQDSRICLLNALKPYMNTRRRDAIDKLVKFSSLSELLKKL
jgi:hypothetical protein